MRTQRLGSIQALLALCLFLLSLSSASFASPAHLSEITQPSSTLAHCQECPQPSESSLDCCVQVQSCSSCINLSQNPHLTLLTTSYTTAPERQSKLISLYYPPQTPPPKQLL